ncbi:hypothetical protein ACFL08_04405 [Patescibacteria group bacterium]
MIKNKKSTIYAWDVPMIIYAKFSERYAKKEEISREFFNEDRREYWLLKEISSEKMECDGLVCLRIVLDKKGQPRRSIFYLWDSSIDDYELAVGCNDEENFFSKSSINIDGWVDVSSLGQVSINNSSDELKTGPFSRLILRAMFFANQAHSDDRFRSFVFQDCMDESL